MDLRTNIIISDNLKHSKEVIERIINTNLEVKMDSAFKRFDGEDKKGILDVRVEENSKSLFNGSVTAKLDGHSFRFEREDYQNLDDLINNLFEHFKNAILELENV